MGRTIRHAPVRPRPEGRCQRDHDDWHLQKDGGWRCRECKNLQQRLARGGTRQSGTTWAKQNGSDKGYVESTFTYTEIMKARGYVDQSKTV